MVVLAMREVEGTSIGEAHFEGVFEGRRKGGFFIDILEQNSRHEGKLRGNGLI